MKNSLSKITELAEIDALEREVLDQLVQNEKLAELGRLTAGLVHELNTPLSVISSAAQMVLREEELSDFMREMMERIHQEALRLSQFSRGLLSFARQDASALGEVSLAEVIHEVMVFLRYEARKRSVLVVEDLDYRLPPVFADPNHLKQIFMNLITNGLQAMENGGTLVLTALLAGEAVQAHVADTGPGIPVDRVDQIFEPFFTTKKAGEGTGLGLFITRKILELYNGRIHVISIPHQGTTFFVTLPVTGELLPPRKRNTETLT